MKKALLFDFDGTLLNTNNLIIESFMHVFDEKFPGQFTKSDCLAFIGPSLKETFEKIAPDQTEQLITQYRAWNELHHDELVTEYDGVVETLNTLHEMGIRLVIVSTKIHDNVVKGLNVLGVTHLFEHIIGFDDVQHVKPHPEPIEKALALLQLEKEDVIMIGDNSHDIEAAHNAGVDSAGVAWSIRGEAYLQQYRPTYILQHMSNLIEIVKGS
jgi:pyrophosphatase PpaX